MIATDMTRFLHARLEEDERIARAAIDVDDESGVWDAVTLTGPAEDRDAVVGSGPAVQHVTRHDPARVLADVDATRALVTWLNGQALATVEDGATVANVVLLHLVQPWAEHPHFHPSWHLRVG